MYSLLNEKKKTLKLFGTGLFNGYTPICIQFLKTNVCKQLNSCYVFLFFVLHKFTTIKKKPRKTF